MALTTRPSSRFAAAGAVLFLFSACGGGGSADTPAMTPSPLPTPAPSPNPSPAAGLTKDFQLSYLSPTQGILTLEASAIGSGSATARSNAQPLLSVAFYDGEWSNGVPVSNRPHTLVFLEGNAWRSLSLRSASAQGVSTLGVTEERMVCPDFGEFAVPDFANPSNSVLIYVVAGSDGNCGTADDFYTGFRLGGSERVDFGAQPPFRQFRDSNGGLTGLLIQVGSELRLYTPGSRTFITMATGIVGTVRNAASFARTLSSAWMRWDNGSRKAIYRVDSSGSVSAPLYSVPSADTLGTGFADTDALFVSHSTAATGTSEVVRVPYAGGSSVLATLSGGHQTVGMTANTLLIQQFNADNSTEPASDRYLVLSKSGGTPVFVTRSSSQSFLLGALPFPQTVSNNQFLLNAYESGSNGTTVTALVFNEQGQITESFPRSEWVGTVGGDLDLSQQILPVAVKGARVESYSGAYDSSGHQGGTVVVRDFIAGTRSNVAEVGAAGRLFITALTIPADLALFETSDGSNSDIFAFDLDRNSFAQVTDSPTTRESLP